MQVDDISAIKAMRECGRQASRAGDMAALRSIMSEDAVVLARGARPQAVKDDRGVSSAHMAEVPADHEMLDYRFELSEPEIIGNMAIEYGRIAEALRSRDDGQITESQHDVLRVLRKEADGQWRVYRTIW